MTKILLPIILIFSTGHLLAQTGVLNKLTGRWENDKYIQQFDLINPTHIKGVKYSNNKNKVSVIEYIDIKKTGNIWKYQSTIIGNNKPVVIDISGTVTDSTLSFEGNKKQENYRYEIKNGVLLICENTRSEKCTPDTYKKITESDNIVTNTSNPNYDESLAKKLGSDDYGMKSYFWVILKSGSYTGTDTTLRKESFRQHLANINRLVDEGKMIVAGPLAKNDNNYRGIFILQNIKSKDELTDILNSDLAIKNKFLDYEIYTWFGSAALPLYLPESDKIWKTKP